MNKLTCFITTIICILAISSQGDGFVALIKSYILVPPNCIACYLSIAKTYFTDLSDLDPNCAKKEIKRFGLVRRRIDSLRLRHVCKDQYPEEYAIRYETVTERGGEVLRAFETCYSDMNLSDQDKELLRGFTQTFEENRKECQEENFLKSEVESLKKMFSDDQSTSGSPSQDPSNSGQTNPTTDDLQKDLSTNSAFETNDSPPEEDEYDDKQDTKSPNDFSAPFEDDKEFGDSSTTTSSKGGPDLDDDFDPSNTSSSPLGSDSKSPTSSKSNSDFDGTFGNDEESENPFGFGSTDTSSKDGFNQDSTKPNSSNGFSGSDSNLNDESDFDPNSSKTDSDLFGDNAGSKDPFSSGSKDPFNSGSKDPFNSGISTPIEDKFNQDVNPPNNPNGFYGNLNSKGASSFGPNSPYYSYSDGNNGGSKDQFGFGSTGSSANDEFDQDTTSSDPHSGSKTSQGSDQNNESFDNPDYWSNPSPTTGSKTSPEYDDGYQNTGTPAADISSSKNPYGFDQTDSYTAQQNPQSDASNSSPASPPNAPNNQPAKKWWPF